MKIKTFLFGTYIICNQITFQVVFAQNSDDTRKPYEINLENFYSLLVTALVPLVCLIIDKGNDKNSKKKNVNDNVSNNVEKEESDDEKEGNKGNENDEKERNDNNAEKKGTLWSVADDFLIILSILLCPYVNAMTNYDTTTRIVLSKLFALVMGVIIIFYIIYQNKRYRHNKNPNIDRYGFGTCLVTTMVISFLTEFSYLLMPHSGYVFNKTFQECYAKFGFGPCRYSLISTYCLFIFTAIFLGGIFFCKLRLGRIRNFIYISFVCKYVVPLFLGILIINNFIISALLFSQSVYVTNGVGSLTIISLTRLITSCLDKTESMISFIIHYSNKENKGNLVLA